MAGLFGRDDTQAGLAQFFLSAISPGSTMGTTVNDAVTAAGNVHRNEALQQQQAYQQWLELQQHQSQMQLNQAQAAKHHGAAYQSFNQPGLKAQELAQQEQLKSRELDIRESYYNELANYYQAQIANMQQGGATQNDLEAFEAAVQSYNQQVESQALTGSAEGHNPTLFNAIHNQYRAARGLPPIDQPLTVQDIQDFQAEGFPTEYLKTLMTSFPMTPDAQVYLQGLQ